MQKIAKNDVFGCYIDFGLLDWSHTAYSDKETWYSSSNSNQEVGKGHWLCIIKVWKVKKLRTQNFWKFNKSRTQNVFKVKKPRTRKVWKSRSREVEKSRSQTDVEPMANRPCYSSHRQLRSGFLFAVSPSVGLSAVFPENRAQDFSDILHECSLL